MAKSYYAYRDENVKRVGTVTVVDGALTLTDKGFNELQDKFDELACKMEQVTRPQPVNQYIVIGKKGVKVEEQQIGECTGAIFKARAYSKCDSTDTYNAKTGLVIASRKVEEKLNRRALKDITALRQSLEELLTLVKSMEDSVDYKVGKLTLDLAKYQEGVDTTEE